VVRGSDNECAVLLGLGNGSSPLDGFFAGESGKKPLLDEGNPGDFSWARDGKLRKA
jgi:hypothetical protein